MDALDGLLLFYLPASDVPGPPLSSRSGSLAAQYRTDAVLTLDRGDFRVVRPLTPHKFSRLLPDDL